MATSTAAMQPGAAIVSKRRLGSDAGAYLVTFTFASLILLVTLLIVWELWLHSSPAREKFGLSFLTSRLWNPVTDQFGAWPFVYGTLLTAFLALLIAVPLGVGAAIYLSELARP